MNEIQKVKIDVLKQTIPVLLVAIFSLAGFLTLNFAKLDPFVFNCSLGALLFLIVALLLVFVMIYDCIMQMTKDTKW